MQHIVELEVRNLSLKAAYLKVVYTVKPEAIRLHWKVVNRHLIYATSQKRQMEIMNLVKLQIIQRKHQLRTREILQ